MELDQAAKKTVLRDFTYGLYAVTAAHDGERGVFTANWLSQASFDPPLVMLSVENESSTLELIRASGRFVVCPLGAGQKPLAAALGKPKARVVKVAFAKEERSDRTLDPTVAEAIDALWSDRSVVQLVEFDQVIARVARGLMRRSAENGTITEADGLDPSRYRRDSPSFRLPYN